MKKFLLLAVFTLFSFMGQAQLSTDYFITKWDTGSETSLVIRATGSYTVFWEKVDAPNVNGSGTYTSITTANHPTVDFGSAGTYIVRIVKSATPAFNFSMGTTPYPEAIKLLEVQQWGTNKWPTAVSMFNGCSNMDITATDIPDFSAATTMNLMFNGCTSLKGENQDFTKWNVGNVTGMSTTFSGCTKFNRPLTGWNTGKVTTFYRTFYHADSFNQPLNSWNLSAATQIHQMFAFAAAFNQPLNSWNITNVTNLTSLFYSATAFNQSLADWSLKNGVTTNTIFAKSGIDCENYNLTLIGWANNTSIAVVTLDATDMIYSSEAAIVAHNMLITTKGWTINNDIYDEDCDLTNSTINQFDVQMNVAIRGRSAVVSNLENGDILQLIGVSGNIISFQQTYSNEITFDINQAGVYIIRNTTQNKYLKVLIN